MNIPMSTLINNLDNLENSNIDDNINLDEIIVNQSLIDNNFIKYLNDNSAFEYSSKDPSVHLIGYYYMRRMYNEIFPSCKNNSIITLIRFIHIVGIIFISIGCLLPRKFLTYHILFCIQTLICWDIFDDKCYMSMIIQRVKNKDKYDEFIPANMMTCRYVTLAAMSISIFGLAFPNFSLFSIILKVINYLKNFN